MDSDKKRQYDMDNRVNPMKVYIQYKNYKLGIFIFSLEFLRMRCWVCVGISSLDGMVDEKA